MSPADTPSRVQRLNSDCFCIGVDEVALREALERDIGHPGLFELVRQRCPHLFAAQPVFVAKAQIDRMARVIQAIESVIAMPAYRERVLSYAPPIARQDPGGARGVFFGYDFHVTEQSLGLIEINTNAGGAMLNDALARAQRACCPPMARYVAPLSQAQTLEHAILAMVRQEWASAGHERPLASIAIVDDSPAQQYLYPEFLLFQRLFERNGIQTVIADPGEFRLSEGRLMHEGQPIDLVYNRLTDFDLSQAASQVLREAYLTRAAVLTPHPQAHALYADKRNLAVLSDPAQLSDLGVPAEIRDCLRDAIPPTVIVDGHNAERLWAERRHHFFKPFGGFGSRAAYRGDKLTRRVWQEILAGGYVAQELVDPGERSIGADTPEQRLKFDLRHYTYEGQVQWLAARLYRGQTTNFRTPGGGFAAVYPDTTFCSD